MAGWTGNVSSVLDAMVESASAEGGVASATTADGRAAGSSVGAALNGTGPFGVISTAGGSAAAGAAPAAGGKIASAGVGASVRGHWGPVDAGVRLEHRDGRCRDRAARRPSVRDDGKAEQCQAGQHHDLPDMALLDAARHLNVGSGGAYDLVVGRKEDLFGEGMSWNGHSAGLTKTTPSLSDSSMDGDTILNAFKQMPVLARLNKTLALHLHHAIDRQHILV